MAVDHDGVPAERAPAARQRLHVVAPHRRAALAEPVDIRDATERVETVHGSDVSRFPDRSFGRLAVAEHDVRPIVGLDTPGVERGADRRAHTLTQRAGGDVDERQPGRRMSFEIRIDLSEVHQLGAIERARFRPERVQDRRGVPLRQHESVGVDVMRVFRIEPHLGEEERRQQVGGRTARRRMSGAGFGCGFHRVDPEPCRDVPECGNQSRTV